MKRKIDAREAVRDFRAGVDDVSLMKKYRITSRGLNSLFSKLVAASLITKAEMTSRAAICAESVIIDLQEVSQP
jgi:hypothetical protein